MKKKWLAWLLIFAVIMGSAACMPVSAAAAAKLSAASKMIEVGKSFTLTVSGTKQKASFSSADKAVATVTAKGVVTAKKVGKTTITAKVGRQTLKCTVRVTYKRTKFTLRGQNFTMAIPPSWVYQYEKRGNQDHIVFYNRYVYENLGQQGAFAAITAETDKEFDSYEFGRIYFGKLGKYCVSAYYSSGYGGYPEDEKADKAFWKSLNESHSIFETFLPAPKSAKQKAYNAYYDFMSSGRAIQTGCPFALAYITNDDIPELIVNTTDSKYRQMGPETDNILIYTYKGGKVTLLCRTDYRKSNRKGYVPGYYFKTGAASSKIYFIGDVTIFYSVAKGKQVLSRYINNDNREVYYYNASGKKTTKAYYNAAVKKITQGKKFKAFAFYKNTLANRKKYLHN